MENKDNMVDRGFGLELEDSYGDTTVSKSAFDPNFWNQADEVDFKLNDEPITKSGGSRMNKRARAGVMKLNKCRCRLTTTNLVLPRLFG